MLWLFFTTNPAYLVGDSPEGAGANIDNPAGFTFSDAAQRLGLTEACVQSVFAYAKGNIASVQSAAALFQKAAVESNYDHGGSCGKYESLMRFAATAKEVWPAMAPSRVRA